MSTVLTYVCELKVPKYHWATHEAARKDEIPGCFRLSVAIICAFLLASCGGRAYVYEEMGLADLRARSQSQTEGTVQVAAAVPGREETAAIFGVQLYDKDVQPVWLEVRNNGPEQIRYAPVSTDRFYFSPLEVAWSNRRSFSQKGRAEMNRRFEELAMPRYVDPGEVRSGFVLTHADYGAKGFNVELFGPDDSYSFTFLVRVPGFVPDYANVDFDSIYPANQLPVHTGDDLRQTIKDLPCCSTDESGAENGDPINVVFIGDGEELVYAMLRGNWIETSAAEAAREKQQYLFGRQQDAIFRYHKTLDDSFYELRAWLAPFMAGDERVWVCQVRHFFRSALAFTRFDPNVDNARNFTLHNHLYAQSLEKFAWLAGSKVSPVESFWTNLLRPGYFSDGYRVVLWSSAEPYSILDATLLDWDDPPG
jgi:hypothetical protein